MVRGERLLGAASLDACRACALRLRLGRASSWWVAGAAGGQGLAHEKVLPAHPLPAGRRRAFPLFRGVPKGVMLCK